MLQVRLILIEFQSVAVCTFGLLDGHNNDISLRSSYCGGKYILSVRLMEVCKCWSSITEYGQWICLFSTNM